MKSLTLEAWTRFIQGGTRARRAVEKITATQCQRATVALIPEKQWQENVEQMANFFRWKKYHTLDSRGADPDFPDLILLRGRRQVVAELKRDGESPTDGQAEWLRAFAAAGAETYVWHPADIMQVAKVLR